MTADRFSPVTTSYLIGSGVGVAIGGALTLAPFVPWQVGAATGVVLAVVTVVFVRSLIDPSFLLPGRHVAPWSETTWEALAAEDNRKFRELKSPGPVYRMPIDVTGDEIPGVEFLVTSRRGGVR